MAIKVILNNGFMYQFPDATGAAVDDKWLTLFNDKGKDVAWFPEGVVRLVEFDTCKECNCDKEA